MPNHRRLALTKKMSEKKTYGHECPLTGYSQKYILKSFTFILFSSMYLSTKRYFFEWFISRALITGTHNRNIFFCLFLNSIFIKQTYRSECPITVDWQSPDCESQILMVLSQLPLAICFPSGLHATEKTLKL